MAVTRDDIEKIYSEIGELPKGNITYKTIRGKRRMYLQWTEDGTKKSRYVKAAEEGLIIGAIAKRKMLEEEHRRLLEEYYNSASQKNSDFASIVREEAPRYISGSVNVNKFETGVVIGEALLPLIGMAGKLGKRECYEHLRRYVTGKIEARICVLYGLRRTGKTIMLFQAISELPLEQTAYIKMKSSDDMGMLNKDLRQLSVMGIKYAFIDEVTLMEDFIDSASLLSDIYAASGMKIVLSGTDSLGFMLSIDDELYDRAYTIHTTFIPFREYARLLNIHNLDEYIRYGGTFRLGESDYGSDEYLDDGLAFRDDESTRKYIDTAIARNIQHSLSCYRYGGHFRHLIDLYDKNELTSAINRIIEDMNHRFVLSVLTRDFVSHDLGSVRQIDRKRAIVDGKVSALDSIDVKKVTERLKRILEIRNNDERRVELTDEHVIEIKDYLKILDLIMDCPSRTIGTSKEVERIIFTQPGMRYCQAQALVYSLMADEAFMKYPLVERNRICNTILEDVKGRMLEDIVIMETRKRMPRYKNVFKLSFPIGEYDMVIQDENDLTCEIFEIKHSSEVIDDQFKHLVDKEKNEKTEFQFGTIVSRNVLYNGKDKVYKGINYINIAGYLEKL
ncbi:AAA family ATPase [Butyrivibrio sp. VCB2006]|uniref:AAA family ATPase n=1 Tax=Butyrivibrio sp. VCB2006 TaxID=1280679 RepID=UPI0004219877|nr:AAA family ATPase [Butyrivibrio sp. VCB2006]